MQFHTEYTVAQSTAAQSNCFHQSGFAVYSHLSNNSEGWNKRGGSAKVAKSIIVEVGINVEGGIFLEKTSI